MYSADIVICGAGIIGLTLARELLKNGASDIIILEKESGLGKHASGRNSGVLHAGIYYDPGTLKAKMCFKGNQMMQEYCSQKRLAIFKSGKVIVARDESELPTLHELQRRAVSNGASVNLIDEKELSELEPNAKTVTSALHSPLTAVVDPKLILTSLKKDLEHSGKVRFFFNTKFIGQQHNAIKTNQGNISYSLFINAAGAFSDKVAHAFGVGYNYRLLPFKGIYRKLTKQAADRIQGSIYPVPNIKNPFLGVHFTRSVHGDVYVGPTAIPAFGRENYGILEGLNQETIEILFRDLNMVIANKKFRAIAMEEPRKYFDRYFYQDAAKLVKHLDSTDMIPTNKIGIRPQLVDIQTNELVMDFLVKRENNTIHILNSISPAFTSSMYFAKMVVEEYIN